MSHTMNVKNSIPNPTKKPKKKLHWMNVKTRFQIQPKTFEKKQKQTYKTTTKKTIGAHTIFMDIICSLLS